MWQTEENTVHLTLTLEKVESNGSEQKGRLPTMRHNFQLSSLKITSKNLRHYEYVGKQEQIYKTCWTLHNDTTLWSRVTHRRL